MIEIITTHSAVAIDGSNVSDSGIIALDNIPANAEFALDLTVTGDGQVDVYQLVGDSDSDTFYKPAHSDATICSDKTKTSNATGRDRYPFTLVPTRKLKIRIEEDSGVAVTVTSKLIVKSGGDQAVGGGSL